MKNKWHKLFNNKNFLYHLNSKFKIKSKNYFKDSFLLSKIIYPGLNLKKFKKIINFISDKLKVSQGDSLLDFGSGNGGILYYFIKKYNLKNNYSFEISTPLINLQKKYIKKTLFYKTHHLSNNLTKKFKHELVDYSMSISVFQYFYNNKYFYEVLDFLIKVTKKKLLIYDIKDFKTKKKFREIVRKRQNLSKSEFLKKYKNTPIRFYDKSYIKNILKKLQKKYDFSFKFKNLPNTATDYKFGYCLIINKNKYIKF
tara:strand:+ start:830 stop:1594 length:765 start_codon:yes stop_codon:yes gene_type:complete